MFGCFDIETKSGRDLGDILSCKFLENCGLPSIVQTPAATDQNVGGGTVTGMTQREFYQLLLEGYSQY